MNRNVVILWIVVYLNFVGWFCSSISSVKASVNILWNYLNQNVECVIKLVNYKHITGKALLQF